MKVKKGRPKLTIAQRLEKNQKERYMLLWQHFLKCNKTYRENVAKKNGYESAEAYEKFLMDILKISKRRVRNPKKGEVLSSVENYYRDVEDLQKNISLFQESIAEITTDEPALINVIPIIQNMADPASTRPKDKGKVKPKAVFPELPFEGKVLHKGPQHTPLTKTLVQ